jgi:hypothetical protein
MAATYTKTVIREENTNGKNVRWVGTIAYSSQAYSSGVAVSGASMGMPTTIEELTILGDSTNSVGTFYKWDPTNVTIHIYNMVSGAVVEASGNQTLTVIVSAKGW